MLMFSMLWMVVVVFVGLLVTDVVSGVVWLVVTSAEIFIGFLVISLLEFMVFNIASFPAGGD